jgi:AcrR family transcriptional regulator
MTAAAELVQEVGWGSVSTRAVAQRAGLPPGLVHYHFRSVTDLLVDATVPVLAGLVDELAELTGAAPDLPAGIDALLAAVAGYATDEPASRLAAEVFLAAGRVPRLRTELAEVLARARAVLASWLRRRGYRGDPTPVAALLVAVTDGLVLHRAVDKQLDLASLAAPLRAMVGAGRVGEGEGNRC